MLWPLGSLRANTDDSCWNLSIKVYATSSTRNTNGLLEPQGLQSYNTNSSWQWGHTLNKMRCKFTLYAKYLKKMRYGKSVSFLLNIFLAWQFLMSSRQCSSYKLMTLQIWPFFSSYHAQFLETHYSYLIELFTDMPQAMLNKQVTMARNYFKSFCSCKIVRSSSDGFVIRS